MTVFACRVMSNQRFVVLDAALGIYEFKKATRHYFTEFSDYLLNPATTFSRFPRFHAAPTLKSCFVDVAKLTESE